MSAPSKSDRSTAAKFTHVCLDCGALGTAGGYHDHGYENAGDTIPLTALPAVLRSFQAIETERDEFRAENERLREALTLLRDEVGQHMRYLSLDCERAVKAALASDEEAA